MARTGSAAALLHPASFVRRAAVSRGLLGGERLWRVVFAVIYGRKLLRRLMRSEPQTFATAKLKPGQFVRIEAIDPRMPVRSKRRRRRRS